MIPILAFVTAVTATSPYPIDDELNAMATSDGHAYLASQARLLHAGPAIEAALPRWREAEVLAGLVEFVVVPRPGESPATLPAPFRVRALTGFPLGISSSQIRARIKAGRTVDALTPPAVAEAIRNNRLYL